MLRLSQEIRSYDPEWEGVVAICMADIGEFLLAGNLGFSQGFHTLAFFALKQHFGVRAPERLSCFQKIYWFCHRRKLDPLTMMSKTDYDESVRVLNGMTDGNWNLIIKDDPIIKERAKEGFVYLRASFFDRLPPDDARGFREGLAVESPFSQSYLKHMRGEVVDQVDIRGGVRI